MTRFALLTTFALLTALAACADSGSSSSSDTDAGSTRDTGRVGRDTGRMTDAATDTPVGTDTMPVGELCADAVDNDGDGLIDCADVADCGSDPACATGGDPEICDNGMDDDGDALGDCADPDCAGDAACVQPGGEVCTNGADDDGDGLVDCADAVDCGTNANCVTTPENCSNGVDDDGDGLADCDDAPDCSGTPACGGSATENCTNGLDDDGDALADCDDADCAADPFCSSTGSPEVCTNGTDDDLDSFVDCADTDCSADPACAGGGTENCGNGVDDDSDGDIDCGDLDCLLDIICLLAPFEECANSTDDDLDGLTDCDDPDCSTDSACTSTGMENCNNGDDDDGDGLADCDDADCVDNPACAVSGEDCTNGTDDDGDMDVDCDDADCTDAMACADIAGTCAEPLMADFGNTTGSTLGLDGNHDGTCRSSVAPEAVYAFTATYDGDICLDTNDSVLDTVLYVRETCDMSSSEIDCDDDGGEGAGDSELRFRGTEGQTYYVFVDGYSADGGYELNIRDCAGGTCDRPVEIDGFGAYTGDNEGAANEFDGTCRSGAGREIVHEWTAPKSGWVCADTEESAMDTVLYVRTTCDDSGSQIVCDDDGGVGTGDSFLRFEATEDEIYYVVVDGYSSTSSGGFNLNLRDCNQGTCAEPIEIDSYGVNSGDTSDGEQDFTDGSCFSTDGPDVVYAFTPPETNTICVDTEGSAFDTVLYARSTCDSAGSELECNDDAIGTQSQIQLDVVEGETVYLVVDGNRTTSSGQYFLNVFAGICD